MEVLRYAAEHPTQVGVKVIKGILNMPSERVVDEMNAQVYSALMALTTNDPVGIVLGA